MYSSEFNKLVAAVIAKSPFQKKKLEQYLSKMNDRFFEHAEEFAHNYIGYLDNQGIPIDYAITAYLDMCKSMMKCQIEFMKTGTYSTTDNQHAFDNVYSNQELMKSYMIALAISQFLWPTHYKIYEAFDNTLCCNAHQIASYLEIGPGHGLYLNKAMQYLKPETSIEAVDISPISMEITKSIISFFHPHMSNAMFWTGDILVYETPSQYDFITMGEVLEHVNHPDRLLSRIADLLTSSGKAFITTSINSPAIDHVYHFKSVDDVRSIIHDNGLDILNEQILPVEELPMSEIVDKRITINYSALLARSTKE